MLFPPDKSVRVSKGYVFASAWHHVLALICRLMSAVSC